MTLQMNGINVIPLPTTPELGFTPSVTEAEALITPKTRAIVLVTPNNPTGAVYSPETIKDFASLAQSRKIALILDETYRDFVLDEKGTPSSPHTLFALSAQDQFAWRTTIVHLFSFSKSYAIHGHRLGAIVASPSFLSQVRTVLDCIQVGWFIRKAHDLFLTFIPHDSRSVLLNLSNSPSAPLYRPLSLIGTAASP